MLEIWHIREKISNAFAADTFQSIIWEGEMFNCKHFTFSCNILYFISFPSDVLNANDCNNIISGKHYFYFIGDHWFDFIALWLLLFTCFICKHTYVALNKNYTIITNILFHTQCFAINIFDTSNEFCDIFTYIPYRSCQSIW